MQSRKAPGQELGNTDMEGPLVTRGPSAFIESLMYPVTQFYTYTEYLFCRVAILHYGSWLRYSIFYILMHLLRSIVLVMSLIPTQAGT